MNVYREVWIRRMLDREARMVDMQIMGALQNGTAFFASTSLIAVGGALAAARDQRGACRAAHCRSTSRPRRRWEIKCVGLILIFVYAFFKFAWSYRLFNYVSILLGRCRRCSNAIPRKPKPTSCAPQDCSKPRAGISIAASAPSSLRSAISAGSSSLGAVRHHRRRRDRHLPPAIRLQRLEGDGTLATRRQNPAA